MSKVRRGPRDTCRDGSGDIVGRTTLQAGVLVKAPTAKRMREAFPGSSNVELHLIRKLARTTDDAEMLRALIDAECVATHYYYRRCHSDPFASHMWRVTLVLHAIDGILGTHGVEPLRRKEDGITEAPSYEYLNAGDTYATTLIYHRDANALRIGAWGDIVEHAPEGTFE